jgi:hypothetical protein
MKWKTSMISREMVTWIIGNHEPHQPNFGFICGDQAIADALGCPLKVARSACSREMDFYDGDGVLFVDNSTMTSLTPAGERLFATMKVCPTAPQTLPKAARPEQTP